MNEAAQKPHIHTLKILIMNYYIIEKKKRKTRAYSIKEYIITLTFELISKFLCFVIKYLNESVSIY